MNTRKITVTYELPEEICEVLEQRAAAEGRRLEDIAAEHMARHRRSRPQLSPEERAKYTQELERCFGTWDSGNPHSSDNEQIDKDIAREYGSSHE